MDFAVTLLLACLGAAAVFLVLFWPSRGSTAPALTSLVGPILGANDEAAIHGSDTSLIPMPDHLRTKDEMVTWLIQELPRLTSGLRERRE
jgi:hypothetical protein